MSGDRDRDEGRFTETVTLEDVLRVFTRVEGPVVTSGDVADRLDCSRETARRKLGDLRAAGRVASRKASGRVLWWETDDRETTGIDPEDPFWSGEPHSGGEPMDEDDIDDVLYGEVEP